MACRMGRILRATHQHPECANLSGIKVGTVQSWTFIVAGMLAGATGILVGINRAIGTNRFYQHFSGGLYEFSLWAV